MELGEKLRQARQDAGLSQKQLCGDVITRNMLSQIENGSAKPSMGTLQYLAARLGKPVSFFLEEQAVTLPNQQIMEAARVASGRQVLDLLEQYQGPDSVFDPERWLMEAIVCLNLARETVAEKPSYARELLQRAAEAGEKTPYYTRALERERLLLCHRAGIRVNPEQLPSLDEELLLRAESAATPEQEAALLEAVQVKNQRWYFLRGKCYEWTEDYQKAAQCYHKAEDGSGEIYAALERCYSHLEDYKKAYEYACKQR